MIALASPPPTPPPPKKSKETLTTVQEGIDSSKAEKSSFKMSGESLAPSDDGEESDVFFDATSDIASHAQSRTPSRTPSPSPSTSTSVSPLPNASPVFKPYDLIENPLASSSQSSISSLSSTPSLSITAPTHCLSSQSSITLVSPPLSPTDDNDGATPLPLKRSNDQLLKPLPTRVSTSGAKGKNPEIIQLQTIHDFTSTPPESPKMSQPSSPSINPVPSKSQLRQSQHSRAHSSPNVLKNFGKGDSDNSDGVDIPDQKMKRDATRFELRRDSSPSPPNVSVLNGAQRLFMQNNATSSRRTLQSGFTRTTMNNFNSSTDGNGFGTINSRRPKITNPPKPAMIMEEEEEE